jgi:hypothetical protein
MVMGVSILAAGAALLAAQIMQVIIRGCLVGWLGWLVGFQGVFCFDWPAKGAAEAHPSPHCRS